MEIGFVFLEELGERSIRHIIQYQGMGLIITTNTTNGRIVDRIKVIPILKTGDINFAIGRHLEGSVNAITNFNLALYKRKRIRIVHIQLKNCCWRIYSCIRGINIQVTRIN